MQHATETRNATDNPATIDTIAPGDERYAAARSTLYSLLSTWLRFPWEEFHELAVAGELAPAARECLAALPYDVEDLDRSLADLEKVDPNYDEFQSAYVGLFDVGAGGPPCPLYGGHWVGDRQKVMEEALRFYRFFGLTTAAHEKDLPDHLATELEFLHFLTFKELEALRGGGDTGSPRRAERDFLVRHPVRWMPLALKKLGTIEVPPFWHAVMRLTAGYCKADAAYLIASEGPLQD